MGSPICSLLDKGADVNAKDSTGGGPGMGLSVLMHASYRGKTEVVKLRLARGAESNARSNNGDTALKIAVQARRLAVVNVLKQAGAKE
ncbi:MAG: ankyrin repeat domain-containing protein [Nitrospirota bacterium]